MDFTQRIRDIMNDRLARRTATFTIANGATESGEVNTKNGVLLALKMPSAMDATNIYVKGAPASGGTFQRIGGNEGVDLAFTFQADRWLVVSDPILTLPFQYLKLESDAGSGESAQRDLEAIIRHLS